jgi:chemotaxis protein MotB
MAGKGGGAWKVAYADFVTAMMAFFLVMWIVAQNKPVKEAVAMYFKDPFGTSSAPGGPRSPFGPGGGLPNLTAPPKGPRAFGHGPAKSESKGAPGKGGAPLEGSPEGEPSLVGTRVSFAEDSAELSDEARQRLTEMAAVLAGKPNKIEIRGHATGRPLPAGSPYADAWQLSYARCYATFMFLQRLGVEPNRMRLSQAGSYEPVSQPDRADWAADNSRVEVFMLGEFVRGVKKPRKDRTETQDPDSESAPPDRTADGHAPSP